VVDSRILVLGLSFKENCPDLRNTRVVDIRNTLSNLNAKVDVFDPWVDSADALHEFGFELIDTLEQGVYDSVIIAVGHREFAAMTPVEITALCRPKHVIFDVKYLYPIEAGFDRL
jgi:UDP-N-acetyl-D-galactosamine dehydrogenase